MVFEKLKKILAEQLDVDADSITKDSLLIEDLGADSLDAIDIVMSVEDEFKIEVPDEIIEKIEDGEISNSATAYGLLGEIMNAFPGTWIADKAKELRDNL